MRVEDQAEAVGQPIRRVASQVVAEHDVARGGGQPVETRDAVLGVREQVDQRSAGTGPQLRGFQVRRRPGDRLVHPLQAQVHPQLATHAREQVERLARELGLQGVLAVAERLQRPEGVGDGRARAQVGGDAVQRGGHAQLVRAGRDERGDRVGLVVVTGGDEAGVLPAQLAARQPQQEPEEPGREGGVPAHPASSITPRGTRSSRAGEAATASHRCRRGQTIPSQPTG